MKRIIITTTFRDFNGDVNDKMQMQFLRSLKRQTYRNYVLVVTLFGEKNVENVVRKVLGEKAVFVNSTVDDRYRYSPSKVVLNGIDYGKEKGADILIDCSGDIILQDNFLETVVNHYSELYSGISHPNIFWDVNDDFQVIGKRIGECNRGIDIRFFDFKLLADKRVYRILRRYTFLDWGGFEHFLAAICIRYSKQRINIFEESKVVKCENNREAANESEQYINKAAARNHKILKEAAHEMNISPFNIMDLYYIHLQYGDSRYIDSSLYMLWHTMWVKIYLFKRRSKKWLMKIVSNS